MNISRQCVTVVKMCFWTLNDISTQWHLKVSQKKTQTNNDSHHVSDRNYYNYAKMTTLLEICK